MGYVYIPDMGGDGLNEFVKQFFPQIRKEGMIIDVRYNGGGFVDQLIFERLRRVLAGMDSARNFAERHHPPTWSFTAPWSCITNAYAASDGDIFSYFFKKYHLGPLIGMRTWGGVRGIRGYDAAARRRLHHPAGILASTASTASGWLRTTASRPISKWITVPTW